MKKTILITLGIVIAGILYAQYAIDQNAAPRNLRTNTQGNLSLGTVVAGADAISNAQGLAMPANDGSTAYLTQWPLTFNGTTWDRQRSPSAAVLTAVNNIGGQVSEKGPRWTVTSTPSVSTLATATKAANATGRNVADCIFYSAGSTTAPAATKLNINLRDGASGAGTIILSYTVVVTATTGQNVAPIWSCGLNLVGSVNTAMTLEYSSLLTNLFEDVTITGYTVQ